MVLDPIQQRKKAQAEARKRKLAEELARKEKEKKGLIFVGGKRFKRTGGGAITLAKPVDAATQQAEAKRQAEKARQQAEAKRQAEKARQQAEAKRLSEKRALEIKLKQRKASSQVRQQALIIQRSQQLQAEAKRRGKAFTRLEAERFLGKGGIKQLRQATQAERQRVKAKAPTVKEFIKEVKIPVEKKIIRNKKKIDVDINLQTIKFKSRFETPVKVSRVDFIPKIIKDEKDVEKVVRINLPQRVTEGGKPVVEILPDPKVAPFFEERTIDTFISKEGKIIPITDVFVINPQSGRERKATSDETKVFEESQKVLRGKVKGSFTLSELALQRLQKERQRSSVSLKRELILAGLTAGLTTKNFVTGLVQAPSSVVNLVKNPANLKAIPRAIISSIKEEVKLLRISPTEILAKLGTNLILMNVTTKGLKAVGRVSGRARARISPKFAKVEKGILEVKSVKGKKLKLKIGGTVKKIAEPLRKQIKLEGQRVTAVSAQANKLIGFVKTKRIIRKPIPGQENFSKLTKRLLKRFDEGKINKNEFLRLNERIIQETKGASSLLERSFFADPRGRLRPSRLGLEENDASLLDILAGDIKFKANKPQVLVFEKTLVQKFPKTKTFDLIRKKLKSGKTLTKSESNALLKFQSKVTGKFKPIGALTKEPEIILAPGEIVKKGKTIGVTIIKGRRVPIVSAKVVKSTKTTKNLLKKLDSGKITAKELKTLRGKLKKETGFEPDLSKVRKGARKRVSLQRLSLTVGTRIVARRPKPKKRPTRAPRRPPKRVPTRPPTKPKRVTRAPTRAPKRVKAIIRRIPRVPKKPKRPPTRAPPRPPIRPPKKILPIPLKKKKKRRIVKKKKVEQGFNVLARPLKKRKGQKRPRLVKVNKKPLSQTDANNLRNFIADTSLARTARTKVTKGKPQKPKLKVPKGYAQKTKIKFRSFRIIKGKKKSLPKGAVIEKRTRLLDTKGEKKGITLRKRIAQITPKKKKVRVKKQSVSRIIKRSPKRILSSKQLSVLKKGREKRLKSLKKK